MKRYLLSLLLLAIPAFAANSPIADAGLDAVTRAGEAKELTGQGESGCTFSWTVVSKPAGASDPLLSGETTETLTITTDADVFGEYVLRFQVCRDDDCTEDDVSLGAVVTSEHAAAALQFVLDCANWMSEYGINSQRGIYYARKFLPWEPPPEPSTEAEIRDSRFLNPEGLAAFIRAYQVAPSEDYKETADDLFSACLSDTEGEPGYDGYYCDEIKAGGWAETTKKWKDLGFVYGVSSTPAWLAARLGETETVALPGISGYIDIRGYISIN